MIRLVLVPDRYAHYRQGIFEELSRSYDVTLFASHVTDASNIHLAKEGVFKKNINWFGTRDFFLGDACVWQFGFFKASAQIGEQTSYSIISKHQLLFLAKFAKRLYTRCTIICGGKTQITQF